MKVNREYVSGNNTYDSNVPQYIVVHNTDNFAVGADAKTHARAQFNGNLSASVHYYTDDTDTVYQTASHGRGCWHVGMNYGGRLFGTVNNRNSSPLLCFDIPVIVAMDSKTAGMLTRTGQLMEWKIIYCFIVKILRNRIAKIHSKGYHKYVSKAVLCTELVGMRQKSNFRRGDFCCFIY